MTIMSGGGLRRRYREAKRQFLAGIIDADEARRLGYDPDSDPAPAQQPDRAAMPDAGGGE